jgi:hypothetical protein
VLIDEPHVALNVETNSGRKVVLEKNDEGKNKLKITAGSMQYLIMQKKENLLHLSEKMTRLINWL